MRLSLRFIIPLFLALGALAYAVVPLVDKLALQWFEGSGPPRHAHRQYRPGALAGPDPRRRPHQAAPVFHPDLPGRAPLRRGVLPHGPRRAHRDPDAAGGDPLRPTRAVLEPLGTAAPESRRPAARLGPVPRG